MFITILTFIGLCAVAWVLACIFGSFPHQNSCIYLKNGRSFYGKVTITTRGYVVETEQAVHRIRLEDVDRVEFGVTRQA